MQLRKFYGRSTTAILGQIKRELGSEAIILETNTVRPGSAAARMNPGARYEILAVREETPPSAPAHLQALRARTADRRAQQATRPAQSVPRPIPATATFAEALNSTHRDELMSVLGLDEPTVRRPAPEALADEPDLPPLAADSLLEDLGVLRAQIRSLLDENPNPDAEGRLDLSDYHALVGEGLDPAILAPHFRQWLRWRTAPMSLRRYIVQVHGGTAARMQGESLREWLGWNWLEVLSQAARPNSKAAQNSPRILGMLGATGVGKTTTLAKIASTYRREKRQDVVILTLDGRRIGASDQWRRWAKLMGVEFHEVLSPEDLRLSMESWSRFGLVGIDTPGGMDPASPAGQLYGSILAQTPAESQLVMSATQHEAVSRRQMKQSEVYRPDSLCFTKLDETPRRGGLVNLTMDGQWSIDSLTTGARVPEDWHPATETTLLQLVLGSHHTAQHPGGAA